jgi:hypothetical protein
MRGRLQPAFLGGLTIGVLCVLPFVSCCCCLWMLGGGALAVYLRQQSSPVPIDAAEGALVGLMAGAIGGLIASVLSIPVEAVTGPMVQHALDRVLAANPDVSPNLRDQLERMASGPTAIVAKIIVNMIVYTIFGMLGGLLGVAIFKKNAPPPAGTVDVLPPE